MCLSVVYRGKQKVEALAKLSESGYYWKGVRERRGYRRGYLSMFFDSKEFSPGWNKTKITLRGSGYRIAFHAFRHKKDLINWIRIPKQIKVVQCKINKKDIVAIGTQHGLCVVATRIWMPKQK